MRGVTLIELLVVLGLLSVLAGFGLQKGLQGFERSFGQTDRSRAGSILRHARARSMAGVPQKVAWKEHEHALEIQPRTENGITSRELFELSGSAQVSITGNLLFIGTAVAPAESAIKLSVPQISAWEIHIGRLGTIDTFPL